jgi:hypothetical protein
MVDLLQMRVGVHDNDIEHILPFQAFKYVGSVNLRILS